MKQLVTLFAASLLALGCNRAPEAPPAAPKAASPLAGIALSHPDGSAATLGQWQGKIIVANYWATWCAPCRAEMPEFSELHTALSAQGVQFVGISLDEPDAVSKYARETPVSYPLLIAPLSAIEPTVTLGNQAQALPFTVILDRSGTPVATKLGRFHKADLEARLRSLL